MEVRRRSLKKLGLILSTMALATVALSVFFMAIMALKAVPVQADGPAPQEWILVVNHAIDTNDDGDYNDEEDYGGITMINTLSDTVHGPFLGGQLGSAGGGLFDADVTPDGKTALISNFGDNVVSFVDISFPTQPTFIISVTTEFFAEDVVISPDGKYALVTDGGFSPWIDVLDLRTRTLAYSVELTLGYANAVEIAPDGTVIAADYFGGGLLSLYPDANGVLTETGTYSYSLTLDGQITPTYRLDNSAYNRLAGELSPSPYSPDEATLERLTRGEASYLPRPVNVAVAPDGQTVIACDVGAYNDDTGFSEDYLPLYSVGIYRIIEPGVLTFTGAITGLSRIAQSVAFSEDGTKAYLNGNGGFQDDDYTSFNGMAVLDITGPGEVSLDRNFAVDYPRTTSSQLFGVDGIAVTNGKAYIGYPTISGASTDLRVVNLSDYSVKRLDMPGIPAGVTVMPLKKTYFPFMVHVSQP